MERTRWVRPALLVVTALAALSYCWRTGSTIEIYYAAAVRSMSASWHDFFYGAFDPAGTVSVDKLPGSLWVQALSVRVFGLHEWALLLPQAVEGALTVLVLYHAVGRLAGPLAGLVAAVVLAASPATVTLDRGNIPDTLMILFLVLAADSTVTAILAGRWRSMVLAGVWVGLAFQAKMTEAWLVALALGLAYLVAGHGTTMQRCGRLAVLALVTLVVSVSWMIAVTLTPAAQRPYADGSAGNSVFQQVFGYDGVSRLGQLPPDQVLGQTLGTPLFAQAEPPPAWDRLLAGSYGRDTGWLLPAALIAVAAILVARRREPRTDLPRAGILLWGAWLVVLASVFTVSTAMNSYYAGALSPAVAGIAGISAALAWEHRRKAGVLLAVAAAVLITTGYAVWLLPSAGTGLPPPLRLTIAAAGLAAAAALAVLAATAPRENREITAAAGLSAALLVILVTPAVATISVVSDGLGPFDTPFQPSALTAAIHRTFAPQPSPPGLRRLEAARQGASYLMATQTAALAAPYIFATGQEVVPLGGYTGTVPEPSLTALAAMVSAGRFRLALVTSPGVSESTSWIAGHCLPIGQPAGSSPSLIVPHLAVYYCNA
ncbi:MAG TPA: glycosyltransferase family 39 protein [Trebonia sp.]|nr:glycosyltransferase family 39 protein [Trebonia sp.]